MTKDQEEFVLSQLSEELEREPLPHFGAALAGVRGIGEFIG
jgi:hypothetical protein